MMQETDLLKQLKEVGRGSDEDGLLSFVAFMLLPFPQIAFWSIKHVGSYNTTTFLNGSV